MATRSGRRIHGFIGESDLQVDAEPIAKSVKKTRSKRLKDNNEVLETTVSKSKKRNNYVSYPSDEESLGVSVLSKGKKDEPVRSMRKNALKEHNLNISSTETVDVVDNQKPVRLTRRTKRFMEDESDQNADKELSEPVTLGEKKVKKNKKKKSMKEVANENEVAVPKKSKKKKKSNGEVKNSTPNMSIDSFHSAAGSPVHDEVADILKSFEKSPEKHGSDINIPVRMSDRKRLSVTHMNGLTSNLNISVPKANTPNKKRVSSQNSTFEITDIETIVTATKSNTPNKRVTRQNSSFDALTEAGTVSNTSSEKSKRRSNIKNGAIDSDKTISKKSDVNTTFDKNNSGTSNKLNTTFEKEDRRKSLRLSSTTPEAPMNSTYDKDHQSDILNSTFDKETKLNSTFDKEKDKSNSNKSSLVTSDDASNLTYDKSDERISITSDDSRIENTTPVLIESSLDESRVNSFENKKESPKVSVPTPLKREGTFTKDGPEVESNSSMESNGLRTPTKRMTIATPGSTPFPFSKSGQKEKAMLNVTRSIEKSRVSVDQIDAAPRLTRVMFCSPVNNPAVVAHQKRKVIKSNLKGSNKSFVFEDTVSPVRAAPRKRSYTLGDADEARAKRTRRDQLHAMERLARPRTSTTKPNEPTTPTKRIPTPSKSKSETKVYRTKLPNFAALHQRRFQKMESLDECQERKAKRAKQLLTPSAAVTVLERSSPRVADQGTAKEVKKPDMRKPDKRPESKKEVRTTRAKDDNPEVKVKSKEDKNKEMKNSDDARSDAAKGLPTLASLKRGYTRFGFKMNIGVNPFSVQKESKVKETNPFIPKESKVKEANPFSIPKTDVKVKETRNGLTRQMAQPSLAGVSVSRKEAAKQLVMREKSFSQERRDRKRKETRTVIKGVRTNRRFELQMQMRNIS